MARQAETGFDTYTSILQWADAQGGVQTINSGSARFPGVGVTSQGLQNGQNGFFRKNMNGNQTTLIVGIAVKFPSLPSNTDAFMFMQDLGNNQTTLALTSAGVLQFYRGLPSTNPIGPAASILFTAAVWHHIGVAVTLNGSTGSVQCWLDGTSVIPSTGSLNTITTGNAYANQVSIGDSNIVANILYDDLFIWDGTGGAQNSFPGNRKIISAVAAGAGDFTDFAHTGASTNWQAVSEIPPDEDTSYVSDTVATHRDSYAMQSVTFNGTADYIVPKARIRKDDAGSHTVSLTSRKATNDIIGTAFAVPDSYATLDGGVMTTCGDGTSLTAGNLNSNQIGIKIIT